MSPSPYLWEAKVSGPLAVRPESVWALWDRPARWPAWNPAIKRTEFVGPFVEGATATVRFRRRPALRFTVTQLERRRAFTDEARLVGAKWGHEHRLADHPHGVEVSHRIYFAGPMARVWGAALGRRIQRDLERMLRNEERLAWEIDTA